MKNVNVKTIVSTITVVLLLSCGEKNTNSHVDTFFTTIGDSGLYYDIYSPISINGEEDTERDVRIQPKKIKAYKNHFYIVGGATRKDWEPRSTGFYREWGYHENSYTFMSLVTPGLDGLQSTYVKEWPEEHQFFIDHDYPYVENDVPDFYLNVTAPHNSLLDPERSQGVASSQAFIAVMDKIKGRQNYRPKYSESYAAFHEKNGFDYEERIDNFSPLFFRPIKGEYSYQNSRKETMIIDNGVDTFKIDRINLYKNSDNSGCQSKSLTKTKIYITNDYERSFGNRAEKHPEHVSKIAYEAGFSKLFAATVDIEGNLYVAGATSKGDCNIDSPTSEDGEFLVKYDKEMNFIWKIPISIVTNNLTAKNGFLYTVIDNQGITQLNTTNAKVEVIHRFGNIQFPDQFEVSDQGEVYGLYRGNTLLKTNALGKLEWTEYVPDMHAIDFAYAYREEENLVMLGIIEKKSEKLRYFYKKNTP